MIKAACPQAPARAFTWVDIAYVHGQGGTRPKAIVELDKIGWDSSGAPDRTWKAQVFLSQLGMTALDGRPRGFSSLTMVPSASCSEPSGTDSQKPG